MNEVKSIREWVNFWDTPHQDVKASTFMPDSHLCVKFFSSASAAI
jgi:hypothetical protein